VAAATATAQQQHHNGSSNTSQQKQQGFGSGFFGYKAKLSCNFALPSALSGKSPLDTG